MLTMTEAAAGYLTDVLKGAKASHETAVRLTKKGKGFSSALDTARPGDITIAHSGRNVLLMDATTSDILAQRSLDLRDTPDGPRLQIK